MISIQTVNADQRSSVLSIINGINPVHESTASTLPLEDTLYDRSVRRYMNNLLAYLLTNAYRSATSAQILRCCPLPG